MNPFLIGGLMAGGVFLFIACTFGVYRIAVAMINRDRPLWSGIVWAAYCALVIGVYAGCMAAFWDK